MKLRIVPLQGLVLTLAALLICPGAWTQDTGHTVGVSMHFMRDDYAVAVVDAIEALAVQHPGSTIIVTDANASASKQLADVENLVAQRVDAIIIVPIGLVTLGNCVNTKPKWLGYLTYPPMSLTRNWTVSNASDCVFEMLLIRYVAFGCLQ